MRRGDYVLSERLGFRVMSRGTLGVWSRGHGSGDDTGSGRGGCVAVDLRMAWGLGRGISRYSS